MKQILTMALGLLMAVAMQAETVTVTASGWATEQGLNSNDELTTYSQGDVTFTFSQGTDSNSPVYRSTGLTARRGNSLTIVADGYKMQALTVACSNALYAGYLAESTWSAGTATQGEGSRAEQQKCYWTGETDSLVITFSNQLAITQLDIKMEATGPGPFVVTFLDVNGGIAKQETVNKDAAATAPILPPPGVDCMQFIGWDKPFNNVKFDMTVSPVYERDTLMLFEPAIYVAEHSDLEELIWDNNGYTYNNFSIGNITISSVRFTSLPSPKWHMGTTDIIISSTESFYSLYFECTNEDDAWDFAYYTDFSTGSATSDGSTVIWSGSTNQLTISPYSSVDITKAYILCQSPGAVPLTVTFYDMDGETVLNVDNVQYMQSATAPTPPEHTGYTFTGWDKDFSSVTEDMHVTAIYTQSSCLDIHKTDWAGYTTQIVGSAANTFSFEIGHDTAIIIGDFSGRQGWLVLPDLYLQGMQSVTLAFAHKDYCWDEQTDLTLWATANYTGDVTTTQWTKLIIPVYNDNDNPYDWAACTITLPQAVMGANSAIAFKCYNSGSTNIQWTIRRLELIGTCEGSTPPAPNDSLRTDLPEAARLYDMTGNGLKNVLIGANTALKQYSDLTNHFEEQRTLWAKYGAPLVNFVEDINRDGVPDFSVTNNGYYNSLVSNSNGSYNEVRNCIVLHNCDLNNDGRPDYLSFNANQNQFYIQYGQADGTFRQESMLIYTYAQYERMMEEYNWAELAREQTYSNGTIGLLSVDHSLYAQGLTNMFSGVSLARAPRRAAGIGKTIAMPTKALDFNTDGLMDLVDEKTGVVYLNLSQGRWLKEETGGAVVPADLNGDGILDFVLPGTKVYTAIYTGNGEFELNTIYSDATVDDQLYCYDFDHDGDIDILATFSAAKNSLNTAFTCFFINDGTGHFTQKDANYGTQKLWFTNCQDVDGDGWLDLLAFRGEIDQISDFTGRYHLFHYHGIITDGKIFPQNTDAVVLRGKADLTFQAPESVCPITELLRIKYISQNEGHNVGKMEDLSIEAEDLDGDGKMEIWPTGLNVGYTRINTLENAAANAAPNTPAKPALWYENGILNVSWGNSLDDHTSACDLSYALRIGTTTGGNEILAAHANADGSRRDFLDGNMGKNHSYTIDLTSYAPGTIYVAIQAIDAQHTGSSWSEEATVQHVALPNFTLSKSTVNLNEKVTVSFPALSDGYTQTWSYGNAIKSDETATSMTLSFAESGEKNIMRTITSDGKSSVYSLILTVLPTALGDTLDCPFPYQYLNAADYNYDGYLDYVGADNTVMQSTAINSATQAIALWNTNVKGDVRWLDWNKDGHVDLLLKDVNTYYILAHNGSNSLSTKAEDPMLVSLFTPSTASLEDALVLETIDNVWQYTGLNLEWNGEEVVVPFEQRIARNDCSEPQLADFNSDGYQDLIAKRNSDGAIYILWNRQNEFFSAPFILPLGDLDSYYRMQDLTLVDVDNNGYLDVTVNAPHKAIHMSSTAVYVWYMDAEGLMAQSFINDESNLLIQMPGELFVSNSRYGEAIGSITRVIGNPNITPTAPMNVRAAQTEEGLLIQWDAATDDHTPTEMLRYNLSVKHAGQSGADAYVISPQNGRHANAAFLPGYEYVNATRYLIPADQLTAGDYEISLQTIDLRCAMSAFTTPLSVHFDRLVIEAPVTACANVATTVTYMGESSTQTPVWEFDGATILSGTGFGPYNVQWETAGVKTITLTLGTEVYTRTIQIDEAQANVALPSVLFRNHDMTIALPQGHTAAWGLFIGSTYHDVTARGIDNVDPQLTASGNVLHAGDGIGTDITTFNLTLVLTLANANGCATTIQQAIQIVEEDQLPSIRLVTADADGHHKIEFDVPSSLFPQLQILKETNILNQFVELATVAAADGIYTDLSSNAAQKADRYAVRGVMADGTPVPMSAPHQTVHMTINRGLQEGTYNLIWNGYQGANIVTYNILRGTSDDALTQIASVAASVLSYTDDAPVDEQPIYAIEYVLGTQAAYAPRRVMTTATQLSGRSNTANRAESRVVTFVSSMTIHSANDNYATTAETPSLFLYAELMPINATYKTVKWEITSGAELATIDQTGLLTACILNTGGVVTVKATATDGTGVYATKQINIAPIDGTIPPQPVYYTILFVNWDNTELQRSQVLEGEMPVYEGITPVRPEDEQYIYTFNGWTPTIVAVTADATYTATYEAKDKSEGIEDIFFDASSAPRKVLINNVIYILRGEKVYTLQGQEVR